MLKHPCWYLGFWRFFKTKKIKKIEKAELWKKVNGGRRWIPAIDEHVDGHMSTLWCRWSIVMNHRTILWLNKKNKINTTLVQVRFISLSSKHEHSDCLTLKAYLTIIYLAIFIHKYYYILLFCVWERYITRYLKVQNIQVLQKRTLTIPPFQNTNAHHPSISKYQCPNIYLNTEQPILFGKQRSP